MVVSAPESRLESGIDVLEDGGREASIATVLRVFEDSHGPVYRYVRSFGLDIATSEDVVQEVFLALHRHVGRAGDRTNLDGWVFRVAHHTALKQRARARRWAGVVAHLPYGCREHQSAQALAVGANGFDGRIVHAQTYRTARRHRIVFRGLGSP